MKVDESIVVHGTEMAVINRRNGRYLLQLSDLFAHSHIRTSNV
jgi:hypothetical protein